MRYIFSTIAILLASSAQAGTYQLADRGFIYDNVSPCAPGEVYASPAPDCTKTQFKGVPITSGIGTIDLEPHTLTIAGSVTDANGKVHDLSLNAEIVFNPAPRQLVVLGADGSVYDVGLNCDEANCWVYIPGKYALHGEAP